jgi:hypothetical protein
MLAAVFAGLKMRQPWECICMRKAKREAARLIFEFGRLALDHARSQLDSATAARNHKLGIHWAEVCSLLAQGRA